MVAGLVIIDNVSLERVRERLLEPYDLRQSLLRVFVGACFSCQSGRDWKTRSAALDGLGELSVVMMGSRSY